MGTVRLVGHGVAPRPKAIDAAWRRSSACVPAPIPTARREQKAGARGGGEPICRGEAFRLSTGRPTRRSNAVSLSWGRSCMSLFARWSGSWSVGCGVATASVAAVTGLTAEPAEDPFTAEYRAAMSAMMAGMDVRPSGDSDRDFAAAMIPHHRGAIDMAEAELRHGRNKQLRRIAEEIIVDQEQEIAAMRLALVDGSAAPASPRRRLADAGSRSRTSASFLSGNICSGRPQ